MKNKEDPKISLDNLKDATIVDKKLLVKDVTTLHSLDNLKDATVVDVKLPVRDVTTFHSLDSLSSLPQTKTDPVVTIDKVPKTYQKITSPNKEPPPEPIRKVSKQEAKIQQTFDRIFLKIYISKAISCAAVLILIEIAMHLLRYYEGVDVLNPANYQPFLIDNNLYWNVSKVVAFLVVVYMLTPEEKVVINNNGIICDKVQIIKVFYTSDKVFLRWNEIVSVDYKLALLEPYLYFYGKDKELLGQVDFSIKNHGDFFDFVRKYAGHDHPLYQVMDKHKLY